MHPPHFSILREVFSYTARFLPSKRYYLFLFIEPPLIFLSCFKSTGLWRFHFLPFTMPQTSPWFPEGFIYFSFMAVSLKHSCIFPESIWLLKVFYVFLQLQDAMCIYDLSTCTHRCFSWVLSFPSFCTQCHWHVYFSIILHAQDFLKVFYFFSFITPMLCNHPALRGRVQYLHW